MILRGPPRSETPQSYTNLIQGTPVFKIPAAHGLHSQGWIQGVTPEPGKGDPQPLAELPTPTLLF